MIKKLITLSLAAIMMLSTNAYALNTTDFVNYLSEIMDDRPLTDKERARDEKLNNEVIMYYNDLANPGSTETINRDLPVHEPIGTTNNQYGQKVELYTMPGWRLLIDLHVDMFMDDIPPIISTYPSPTTKPSEMLVPARIVAQGIGYKVTWDAENKAIVLTDSMNEEIIFREGSFNALVKGEIKDIEMAPIIYKGTFMVPIKFLANNSNVKLYLEHDLKWIGISSMDDKIIISTPLYMLPDGTYNRDFTLEEHELVWDEFERQREDFKRQQQETAQDTSRKVRYMLDNNLSTLSDEDWKVIRDSMAASELNSITWQTGNY